MHLLALVGLAKLVTPNSGVTSPGDTYYLDRKDGQFLWCRSDRNLPRVVLRRNGMAHRTAMLQKDREIAGTLWTQAQTQFPQKSFLFSSLLPSLGSAAPSHSSQPCSVTEIRTDYSSEAFVLGH